MQINKNLRVLNSKEIKEIMNMLKEQFGYEQKISQVFLQNNREKVFLINRDIERFDLSTLRIDSAGMYFGKFFNDGFRLSIEGSQLIGNACKKNVFEVELSQKHEWMKGNDLEMIQEENKFIIIRSGNDFIGCGKIKNGLALNSVPKSRRLFVVNENPSD